MRLLWVAALLVAAGTAQATEWTAVSRSANRTWYVDSATIKRNGDIRRFWMLVDNAAADRYGTVSARFLQEMDCNEERYRILQGALFDGPMASGNVNSGNDEILTWKYIVPGSAHAHILKFVCTQ